MQISHSTNDRFDLAHSLLSQGFSVIPLLAGGKTPARKWKKFQTERASVSDLVEWFCNHDYEPAIVTGSISGITVIDCDNDDAVEECRRIGLDSSLQQRTKRGLHFVFRHNGERNTVRIAGKKGLDRRGEGGYVRAYFDSGSWTSEAVSRCAVCGPIGGDIHTVAGSAAGTKTVYADHAHATPAMPRIGTRPSGHLFGGGAGIRVCFSTGGEYVVEPPSLARG